MTIRTLVRRIARVTSRVLTVPSSGAFAGFGVQFAGSQSYSGAVASGAIATSRVRFRLDSLPTTAFEIVAGPNNGGAPEGWLLCWEDNYSGSAQGQLVVYAGTGVALTRVARKFMMPADVGRVFTMHLVCDGSKTWVYLDGKKINVGSAIASIAASTGPMLIGGRSDGSFSSSVTIIDVAEGTTALTPAQVATDVAAATPSFAGQTHRYVASGSVGATWTDQVGTNTLNRFGSPTVPSFTAAYGNHRGTVEIWGDSIALGREVSGLAGDGWVRAMQRATSVSIRACTLLGHSAANTGTFDYDYTRSATGGESINTRIGTLATDLNTYAPADSATLLAYGVNDIVALNRTAVQLRADVTTACGLVNTARPGRPIFVCNVLQVATGSATAGQRTEISTYQSGFAAFIATLKGTYSNVVGIDYAGVVTNPDDTAQLYDGTHPTPTVYAAMAAIIAPAVAAAM